MKKIKTLLATLLLCSTFIVATSVHAENKKKEQKNQEEVSPDDREELNYGYAIMYEHIDDISGAKQLMAIKKNSEQLSKLADEVTATLDKNKKTLDELKKKYPAIDFETRGQPDIIEHVNKAIKWHKTFAYLPLIGMSGPAFERDFVIDTKYGIDQIARISGILSEREKSPGLKKPLKEISEENNKLLQDIEHLLNEKYYKDNLNKKK